MSRIVVVEDNPDNQLLMNAMLGDDYEVRCFDHGRIALEIMAADPPDLVLLDISLPEMDGIEVLRRMREHAQLAGIPVIALTAHAMAGDRERFLEAGFNDYITKPVTDETILQGAIQRLLAA